MDDSRWRVGLSATAAFVIIGCTWAFATARYGGPDEPAHVIRAAAVAQGDLIGRPDHHFEPGFREVRVAASLGTGDPACYRHSQTATAACAAAVTASRPGTTILATSAGTAPPWYYLIVGLGARAVSAAGTVMAYRMVTVLLCAAILGLAAARSRRFGWGGWLIAALTPSTWFLLGVVGTSGIEVALVVLALVEAVARFHQPVREALSRVTLPLAACLLVRPAAAIDVVVVALVLLPTLPRPITSRTLVRVLSPFAVVGAATLEWNHRVRLDFHDARTADSRSLASALGKSLKGIPTTAHQAIGALGWNEFFSPFVTQVLWVATLAFAVWWVWTRSPDRWWHARWVAAALLLPTIIEVAVHRRIGTIWQGRYSIASATGGVLIAARAQLPRRVVMRNVVIAAAVAEVLGLWNTLRRYMVGLDGSLTLRGASWRPPINPWWLIVVNAAAMAWLCVVVLGSGDDVAEHVDDVVGGAGRVEQRQSTA